MAIQEMTTLSQSLSDRILGILANSGGRMEQSRLRASTGIRYALLNPILEELVKEGTGFAESIFFCRESGNRALSACNHRLSRSWKPHPLFAEKLVGDGVFALPMQHSKVDLSLYGDWNRLNRIVDKANADAVGPVWMAGDGFFG